MAAAKTQPARGMRDFLPADVRRREYVIGIIKEVYERYGFEPLETPAVENIETLLGKYGEEGNQLIFKILKRGLHEKTGEADLALRYDLTVPLARVVAQYQNELPKFFKRYQIQPVWRADRPARGRFREFYQCDVDVLGSRSMVVEAELCAAASDALEALGFNDFRIRLNHRGLLDANMSAAMINKDKRSAALITLDKLDKIGVDGVRKELAAHGIPERSIETVLYRMMNRNFLAQTGRLEYHKFSTDRHVANLEMLNLLLSSFKDFSSEDEGKKAAAEGILRLRRIVELTENMSVAKHIEIDPSLARGLSYYTGSIMEISAPDLSGSLGGGGRYDNLVGMFLGKNDIVPACGFSLGLERIIMVMSEREMFPKNLRLAPADVMVTIWPKETESDKQQAAKDSLELASKLRGNAIRVDVYPVRNVKIKTQVAYASKLDIPLIIIIGDDERARDEVTLRDMRLREEHRVKREDLVERIRATLK